MTTDRTYVSYGTYNGSNVCFAQCSHLHFLEVQLITTQHINMCAYNVTCFLMICMIQCILYMGIFWQEKLTNHEPFTKIFHTNSFYLHGSLKFSPAKYFPCTVLCSIYVHTLYTLESQLICLSFQTEFQIVYVIASSLL